MSRTVFFQKNGNQNNIHSFVLRPRWDRRKSVPLPYLFMPMSCLDLSASNFIFSTELIKGEGRGGACLCGVVALLGSLFLALYSQFHFFQLPQQHCLPFVSLCALKSNRAKNKAQTKSRIENTAVTYLGCRGLFCGSSIGRSCSRLGSSSGRSRRPPTDTGRRHRGAAKKRRCEHRHNSIFVASLPCFFRSHRMPSIYLPVWGGPSAVAKVVVHVLVLVVKAAAIGW